MPNGTGNLRKFLISRKKRTTREVTETFEKNFLKFFVPFDYEAEFPEILVEWNAPHALGFIQCYFGAPLY